MNTQLTTTETTNLPKPVQKYLSNHVSIETINGHTIQTATNSYGALYADRDHVEKLVMPHMLPGYRLPASKQLKENTIFAIYWMVDESHNVTTFPCEVISMKTTRDVFIQNTITGQTLHCRAKHLWDRTNQKTGLPLGQRWLDKALAVQIVAEFNRAED